MRAAIEQGIESHENVSGQSLLWFVGELPNMRRAKAAINCNGRDIRSITGFAVDDGHGGKLFVEGIEHR